MDLYYDKEKQEYYKVDYLGETGSDSSPLYNYPSKLATLSTEWINHGGKEYDSWEELARAYGVRKPGYSKAGMYSTLKAMKENAFKKGWVLLPLWKYEHGSKTIYAAAEENPFTHERVDYSLCGVIVDRIRRRSVEEIESTLKQEIHDYSKWREADVWCVQVYDNKGIEDRFSISYGYPEEYNRFEKILCDVGTLNYPEIKKFIQERNTFISDN